PVARPEPAVVPPRDSPIWSPVAKFTLMPQQTPPNPLLIGPLLGFVYARTPWVIRPVESPGHDSSPSTESELGFDVVDVGVDGASGDDQALGDLAVGQSLSLDPPIRLGCGSRRLIEVGASAWWSRRGWWDALWECWSGCSCVSAWWSSAAAPSAGRRSGDQRQRPDPVEGDVECGGPGPAGGETQ